MKSTKLMNWFKPFFVLSIICGFALTATAQNHFPSTVGNTWVLLSTDGTQQRTYSFEGPETIDGEEFIILNIAKETVGTDAIAFDKSWVTVAEDGEILLHQVAFDRGAFGIAEATWDPPVTNFPAALPLGHTWEIVTETVLLLVGAATTTSTLEVVAIEDVETPLGVFKDCVKIETNRKAVTALTVIREKEFLWLAPDVGPVKFFDDTNSIAYDLASYNLAKPAAEEMLVVEDTPVEEPPMTEETPVTEEEPVMEEPIVEETIVEEPTMEEPVVEETMVEEPTMEEPVVEETIVEEPTMEEPVVEETMVEEPTMEEPIVEETMVEEPMPPKEYGFDVTLEPGLNMISIPLMPEEPYTAKSLTEMLNATMVIQFDTTTQEFVGYTISNESDGFDIDGGMGYIVNTPAGGTVKFTGKAWNNQPAMEELMDDMMDDHTVEETMDEDMMDEDMAEDMMDEDMMDENDGEEGNGAVAAAPAISTLKSAWAFIVTSDIRGMQTGTGYTLVAENLRTGTIAMENITSDVKRSAAVWADLNRKSVVEAGDKLEIALYDEHGNVVSGPFQRTVTTADIRNAFLSLQLNVGDVQPKDTILAQNYPNPFNPETWIPYQLSQPTEVTISIHNVAGQLVRTLDLGLQPVGSYMTPATAAYWDGKNAVGERVSSGIYFYTLQTADFAATRRMVILK